METPCRLFPAYTGVMNVALAPRFILFAGLSGTGKTTLAEKLSASISRSALIRRDLISSQLVLAGDSPDAASWRGFEIVFALAEDFLGQGITPILDLSSMQTFVYERTVQLCARQGAPLYVVYCQVAAEERYMRLAARQSSLGQLRAAEYHDQDAVFTSLPPDRLFVDTAQPVAACVQQILAYVQTAQPAPGTDGKEAGSLHHT